MEFERGGYLVHYSWATPDLFDPHSDESFYEMVDLLIEVNNTGTRQQINDICQAFGISFNSDSLLWDQELRLGLKPVSCTHWDWMHILVASGGVFQYEANELVREIQGCGISLTELDDFTSNIKWPSSQTRLSKTFFQDRIVPSEASHLRGFAGEMFLVAAALTLFVEMVLAPAGVLTKHCTCFSYSCIILNILGSGDSAVGQVAELEHVIALHHEIFLRLYSACAKPKLHYLWHVPPCIRKWGVNLNCFSAERKQQRVKDIAKHTYNHLEQHVLGKLLAEDLYGLEKTLKATHLVSSRPVPWATQVFRLVDPNVGAVTASSAAVISVGTVKVGDVFWARAGADQFCAVARGFICLESVAGEEIVYAHVNMLEKDDVIWKTTEEQVLLATSLVTAVLTYFEVPGDIRQVVPRFSV